MSGDLKERLAAAKAALARHAHAEAFGLLRDAIAPDDDFVVQARVARLSAAALPGLEGLKPLKIALLAGTTVDHFADILRYWLARDGFAADIWIAPYDTAVPTVLDEGSELYAFRPDIVWLFNTQRDVHVEVAAGDAASIPGAVEAAVGANRALWQVLQQRLACTVLQNNADIPADDPFGNYAGQAPWARRNLLRRYNLQLAEAAAPGVVIFDLDHLAAGFGRERWVDWRYWYHSKHAFAFDACGPVAFAAARLMAGLKGQARKCLVLDLDNTLWGGVIGDDGLPGIKLGNGADGEAYADFQKYLLTLKRRGIVLAVCSKNEEQAAREPFEKHPGMHLSLDDVAVFRANWQNKADNIRAIAELLNIGLDSLVFVDDNPVERNLVRQFLPMVAVPELPLDPSGYAAAVARQRYFETVGYSAEDGERAAYYRANAQRAEVQAGFTNIDEYLQSLDMRCEYGPLDAFHLPRMAQLINKSNQFHLTGTRYTEAELQALAARAGTAVRYYKLADRFGDNGLIAVLVLTAGPARNLEIDTWVMSCRVLGRGMEEFIANDIAAVARGMGCASITGRYVPSGKNKLVSGLYARLGYAEAAGGSGTTLWRLDVAGARPLVNWIAPASVPTLSTQAESA